MNPLIQFKTTPPLLITLALLWIGLLPRAQAVVPLPDGGYGNFTTAEGTLALLYLTTGAANTGVGWRALYLAGDGNANTGVGAGTLLANTADRNTATGALALLSNSSGFDNTANGAFALFGNTGGFLNTATGAGALFSNTTGDENTANGVDALHSNIAGIQNTANGAFALRDNTDGAANTAIGRNALIITTGSLNTAVGASAGYAQTNGNGNIYIGANVPGVAGENDACYIASIFGQTSVNGIQVLVDSNNKLGTATSSKRFKEDVKSIDKASEALFSLKPVTFRYKKEIDPAGKSQFGLLAEEVEKVNSDLVVRDKEGKPYSVRYDQVNAMLLNEFLKEHRKNEEQQKQINVLTAQLKEQAVQIQKVSAQLAAASPSHGGLEASKFATGRIRRGGPAPQLVNNPLRRNP
jgi:hypothetical protein